MRRLLLAFLLAALAGFGSSQTSPPVVLQAGDLLEIAVVGSKEYSGEVLVLDDGTISGKGFHGLTAAGKTLEAMRLLVTKALRNTFKDPSVSILLKKPKGQFVYVSGAVSNLGNAIPFSPFQSLRQFLAALILPAAPTALDASLNHADGSREVIDLDKVLRLHDPQGEQFVAPGDVIVILPKARLRIWVDGFVSRPGELRVEEGMDVYQALDQAGGIRSDALTPSAYNFSIDEVKVTVQRGPKTYTFPSRRPLLAAPFTLQANDTVSVVTPTIFRVTVGGFVQNPGEYQVREGDQVQKAIILAHGAAAEGTLTNVVVFRGKDVFSLDASAPQSENADNRPLALQNGDTVFVRRNERAIYVLGEVASPGRYLIPDGKDYTAADILALAHGLTGKGTLRRVTLIQPDINGKYHAERFNLDEFLKDGKASGNRLLKSGDILLFGQPHGITFDNFSQVISTVLLVYTLIKK